MVHMFVPRMIDVHAIHNNSTWASDKAIIKIDVPVLMYSRSLQGAPRLP